MAKNSTSTRNPFKIMYKGTSAQKKDGMHRPEGAGNFDNMDDVNIVQSINSRQGTIQHTPVADKDIVNKAFVDLFTADHPHQDVRTTAIPVFTGLGINYTPTLAPFEMINSVALGRKYMVFQSYQNSSYTYFYDDTNFHFDRNGSGGLHFSGWSGISFNTILNLGGSLSYFQLLPRDSTNGHSNVIRFHSAASSSDTFTDIQRKYDTKILEFTSTTGLGYSFDSTVICKDNLIFTGAGKGLSFAEIYAKDNTTVTATSTTKAQILIFDTNGESNNATPDHTNDHITIVKAGKYKIDCSISIKNSSGAAHVISLEMFKNNGATAFNNIHAGRTLGTGTDVGNLTMSGIVDLAVDDTIELWITSDSASARNVTVEDIDLCIFQLSG